MSTSVRPNFMKLQEAAIYLNVSRSTLYRWIDSGELQTIKYPNTNSRLVPIEEIDRIVDESFTDRDPGYITCDQLTETGSKCRNRPMTDQTVCASHELSEVFDG